MLVVSTRRAESISDTSVIPNGAVQLPRFRVWIPSFETVMTRMTDAMTVPIVETAAIVRCVFTCLLKNMRIVAVISGMSIGRINKLIISFVSSQLIHIIGSELLIGPVGKDQEKGRHTEADDNRCQDQCLR